MNVSGFIRGYMSKNMTGETFFMKVADTIEKQLQEWDSTYHVLLLKLKDYVLIVQKGETSYELTISEQELAQHQSRSPFSLDHKIWCVLQQEGLQIVKGKGNYIDHCIS